MSSQNSSIPHPDYNIEKSMLELHLHHPALASDAAQAKIKSMEDKYLHAIRVLEEHNATLTSQRDAAVGDAQHFHDENERLVQEVTFLHGDVACQKAALEEMKKKMEKKDGGEEANGLGGEEEEELDEGEVEKVVVVVFVDGEKKTGSPWA